MAELVECRSDSAYAERPLAFWWQGARLEVVDILKRWRAPGVVGFRVCTQGASLFELLYDEALDEWRIQEL